jgi:flagellar basal body-associated protein FliL
MADPTKDEEDDVTGEEPLAADAGGAKPQSFMKRVLPFVAGGAISVGLGLGSGIAMTRKHDAPGAETHGEKKPAPTLDEFPVEVKLELPKQLFNCADTGQMVAGSVTIQLEVRTTDKWGHPAEKPPLKDAIDPKSDGKYYGRMKDALVMLLSTKISGDLKTARGKELLKLEILDRMNEILFSGGDKDKEPQGVVTRVLFTDFLVQ